MSRVFCYCRVSTADQHPENQIAEIKAAGFDIKPQRVITEHISGSTPARERPQFALLLQKIEQDDVLVVTKLDRLGRNAMDVRSTVEALAGAGVRVHCLALGGVDLTSSAGKMTMQVLCAVAEFERDLLIERTNSGLARVKAEGRKLGRPSALTDEQQAQVLHKLSEGATVYALAQEYAVDRRSIRRVRDNAAAQPA